FFLSCSFFLFFPRSSSFKTEFSVVPSREKRDVGKVIPPKDRREKDWTCPNISR
ncbi:hypothetical protein CSUI_010785, partial [Cystoisospora suis]